MDKVNDAMNSDSSESLSFFKYVFNFDEENKNSMMNMLQYTLLSIIPVLITLRAIKHIVPEEDDTKGSLEISLECIGQIILIIMSIWFTNKIIRYIPTYSGEYYGKFNETNFIIPFIIILATMQTKLGAKLNILIDRVTDLWHGKKVEAPQKGQNTVTVTQPFSGQQTFSGQQRQEGFVGGNNILPSDPSLTRMPPQVNQNFNQMYNNTSTPLQNAQTPGGMIMEPMAANEAGGGWSAW